MGWRMQILNFSLSNRELTTILLYIDIDRQTDRHTNFTSSVFFVVVVVVYIVTWVTDVEADRRIWLFYKDDDYCVHTYLMPFNATMLSEDVWRLGMVCVLKYIWYVKLSQQTPWNVWRCTILLYENYRVYKICFQYKLWLIATNINLCFKPFIVTILCCNLLRIRCQHRFIIFIL